ncbi:hypothetical protein GA0115233_10841, partial [Streptomyces sp. DI166]
MSVEAAETIVPAAGPAEESAPATEAVEAASGAAAVEEA